jgi:hypothetical protein
MPQGARPQVARPHGGNGARAQRGSSRGQYDFEPHGGGFGFQSHSSSGPCFPPYGVRFPQMGHGMFGVFSNTFLGQMSQHWYSSQFTKPSIMPFAHPMSFY